MEIFVSIIKSTVDILGNVFYMIAGGIAVYSYISSSQAIKSNKLKDQVMEYIYKKHDDLDIKKIYVTSIVAEAVQEIVKQQTFKSLRIVYVLLFTFLTIAVVYFIGIIVTTTEITVK